MTPTQPALSGEKHRKYVRNIFYINVMLGITLFVGGAIGIPSEKTGFAFILSLILSPLLIIYTAWVQKKYTGVRAFLCLSILFCAAAYWMAYVIVSNLG